MLAWLRIFISKSIRIVYCVDNTKLQVQVDTNFLFFCSNLTSYIILHIFLSVVCVLYECISIGCVAVYVWYENMSQSLKSIKKG